MQIQMGWTLAEIFQPLWQVHKGFLKSEFQDNDGLWYSWSTRNGPGLPGVRPGSFLFLARKFGMTDAPRNGGMKFLSVLA